jgi:hypothetical protein
MTIPARIARMPYVVLSMVAKIELVVSKNEVRWNGSETYQLFSEDDDAEHGDKNEPIRRLSPYQLMSSRSTRTLPNCIVYI